MSVTTTNLDMSAETDAAWDLWFDLAATTNDSIHPSRCSSTRWRYR
jgi:hypothetical protein